MEKQKETAFLGYFISLILLVVASMNFNLVNLVYLVVIFSCFIKFIVIVNKDRNR